MALRRLKRAHNASMIGSIVLASAGVTVAGASRTGGAAAWGGAGAWGAAANPAVETIAIVSAAANAA